MEPIIRFKKPLLASSLIIPKNKKEISIALFPILSLLFYEEIRVDEMLDSLI